MPHKLEIFLKPDVQKPFGQGYLIENTRFGFLARLDPDDGTTATGVTGVSDQGEPPTEPPEPSAGEPNGAMEALRKERELNREKEKQLKALTIQLQAFEGVDPETAKRAKTLLAQHEEQERLLSKIKAETEQQYLPEIEKLQLEKKQAFQQLLQFRQDTELERAYHNPKIGGIEGEFIAVAPMLRQRTRIEDTGQITALKEDGVTPMFVDGKPATLDHLIEDLRTKHTWFARHFKARMAAGAGIQGSAQQVTDPRNNGLSGWALVEAERQASGRV